MTFTSLADENMLNKTVSSLEGKKYTVTTVENGKTALEKIKDIIPQGSSVMNGSSVTLESVGYQDYLKSDDHKWRDLHAEISAEDDKEKRDNLRRQSVLSDYYLGSVHALVQTGEFVIASNSGSQLPHVVYTSPNLILVVSTKKIVGSLDEAMKRLYEHVVPLEDKHMMDLYQVHTTPNKVLIFNGEKEGSTRKIHFILVKEDLGF